MKLKKINIGIVDDHVLFREGLKDIISNHPPFSVVAEGNDGMEAVQMVSEHDLDVLVMDLRLPVMGGISAIKRIRQTYKSLKIVVVTMYEDDGHKREAILAGADAYLSKMDDSKVVIKTIEKLLTGENCISEELLKKYRKNQAEDPVEFLIQGSLSDAEIRLLEFLSQGKNNKEISKLSGTSERTVKNRLNQMFKKMGAKSRLDAVRIGLQNKLISFTT